jgi:REP element-mobilizing transposase RayT
MKYIFFIILLATIFFIIVYYDRKQSILKHQLMVVNNYNRHLQEILSRYESNKTNLRVEFSTPSKLLGLIKEDTSIFLSPIENTFLLCKTSIKMEVHILDQCRINNSIWFYVTLPTDSNINCRGWVKSVSFTMFYDAIPRIT